MTSKCFQCHKPFSRPEHEFIGWRRLYCSANCRRLDEQIQCKCLVCKKVFVPEQYDARRGMGKYCSRKCMGIGRRGEFSGKKNPFYGKHHSEMVKRLLRERKDRGKTPFRKLIRNSTKYKEWRQAIFLRDDFTCQKCKQRGGELHAHHKRDWGELLDEAKTYLPLFSWYDSAMLYTPLWDLSIGITLCGDCHRTTKGCKLVHKKALAKR